jgi:hypothetical protein
VTKSRDDHIQTSTFCVLELAHQKRREGNTVVLFAYKAGGDDVGLYEWPLGFGTLTASQATDIVGRIAGLVNDSLYRFLNVQQELGSEVTR